MTEPTRKLTLLDVMIMIAATAGGLALVRGPIQEVLHVIPGSAPLLLPQPALDIVLITITSWPLPALWTLALLALRLRSPRPSWRRLSRQPGVIACCAVMFVGTLDAVLLVGLSFRLGFHGDLYAVFALPMGLGVAVAWFTLLIAGRWRPVPSSFDRAGRALGAYWVALIPLSYLAAVTVIR